MTNTKERTILVSGATGQQGGAVTRHLLDRGFDVRALTRDADQAEAESLAHMGVEVVEGNFEDRDSLDRALDGVDGAYSVQNTWVAGPEGEIEQGTAFADAARDAGIDHFVYSSVGGAERDTGIPHFDSKWEIEKHIRAIELPATIFRPVFFMDNWMQMQEDAIRDGELRQPLDANETLQQIAVEDIGFFVAEAFSNPETWLGREVELAGDEPTMAETARTLGNHLENEVVYVQVPWEDFADEAGGEMTAMYRWFDEEGYKADIEQLRTIHPDLRTLDAFLEEPEKAIVA